MVSLLCSPAVCSRMRPCPTFKGHLAASGKQYWLPQPLQHGSRRLSARLQCLRTQCKAFEESPKGAGKNAAHASLLQIFVAGPSHAEQHSGIFAIADIDAKTAATIATFLSPALSISILLMICRIPLSWYPNINGKKFPWAIAVAPTEPILGPTRRAIPPVGGVDIAPIIWVAFLSFINEILLGPQGILNLLQRQADF